MAQPKSEVKLLFTMKRKEGLTFEQLIDHYENVHAPLILRLLPYLSSYTRNYVRDTLHMSGAHENSEFDVIAEAVFPNKEEHEKWLNAIEDQNIRSEIMADEANFLDTTSIRMLAVEAYSSDIPKLES